MAKVGQRGSLLGASLSSMTKQRLCHRAHPESLGRMHTYLAHVRGPARSGTCFPRQVTLAAYSQEGVVRLDVGSKGGQQTASVVIPLNYANLLGLKGRDLYLDPIINSAYDELFHQTLNPGYSAIAKLGKEKLLFAAREALRSVRGRVSLVHPDVTIEPVLLPGTMALLNQLGHYELVLQMAEQVKNISKKDLKASNKGTLQEYQKDVALGAALANCGLAKSALEGGSVSLGYARLDEAFGILKSHGGSSLSPDLYADISQALVDLRSDAVVDTLREPLDLGQVTNRKSAIQSFVNMLNGAQPGITPEFVSRVLSHMTSIEIVECMDWVKATTGTKSMKNPWYTGDITVYVGVAHLVAGFAYRRPYLVAKARRIFALAHNKQADIAIPLAVSEILLGETNTAIGILVEDERLGLKLRGAAHLTQQNTSYPAETLPERDDVMAYVRYNSPNPSKDVLPGVCLFVQLWLSAVAFPRIRDTRERPVSPSLGDYFEAPGAARYLMSKSKGLEGVIGSMVTFLKEQSGRLMTMTQKSMQAVAKLPFGALTAFQSLLRGSNGKNQQKFLNAIGALAGIYLIMRLGGMIQQEKLGARKTPKASTALPKKKSGSKSTKISPVPKKPVGTTELSKTDAQDIIRSWLEIKAEAMGPRHNLQQLDGVLADPMLSAVSSEAREASKSGWFWNIKPLKVRVESISSQSDGSLLAIAMVDENADLWATNGKKGDSYKTSYRVEYTLVKEKLSWKISSALVIGK